MDEKITESVDKDLGDSQVYELGYHVLPTVAEENVSEEVAKIHTLVSSLGGSMISEGVPSMRQLAYDISKKVAGKSVKFSKAYFGWLKFEMERSQVLVLKNKVEVLPNMLRSIIVKTVKENTMYIPKIPTFRKETSEKEVPVEVVEKAPASEAEIDKSIDELVIS